jgi:demethylmenaquinone methyltransferase/2-methoxy-6-polyprenyl-1,4-benzoquinol methylase
MLRPGGLVIIHDFTCPSNTVSFSIWHAWFRFLKIVGGRVWPEWRIVFKELPEFLQQSAWLSETLDALGEHAFTDITSEPLTFGASVIVTARKPGASPHRTCL